jgi:hypothetical protein
VVVLALASALALALALGSLLLCLSGALLGAAAAGDGAGDATALCEMRAERRRDIVTILFNGNLAVDAMLFAKGSMKLSDVV